MLNISPDEVAWLGAVGLGLFLALLVTFAWWRWR
jgi:hypothetical protein